EGGGGVDDAAAAVLEHGRDAVLHPQPHALDVDAHHGVEHFLVHLGEGLAGEARNAGVVEQDVQAPEARHRRVDHGPHRGRVAHVHGDGQRAAAGLDDLGRDRLGLVAGDVGHGDVGAFTPEGKSSGPSDTRAAAGDDGDLVFELPAHDPPPLRVVNTDTTFGAPGQSPLRGAQRLVNIYRVTAPGKACA